VNSYKDRMRRLFSQVEDLRLSGVLLTKPESIYYFCGYFPMISPSAALLVGAEIVSAVVSSLEEKLAKPKIPASSLECFQIFNINKPIDPAELMLQLVKEHLKTKGLSKGRLGTELSSLSLDFYRKFVSKLKAFELKEISNIIDRIRLIKSDDEVQLIEKAARMSDRGQEAFLELTRVGISEAELLARVEFEMKIVLKGNDISVPKSVTGEITSGPGSALINVLPLPRKRRLRVGDLVVADLGARFSGYWADTARTAVVGRPTARQRKMYESVLRAERKAIDSIAPGVPAFQLDRLIREELATDGFGDYCTPLWSGHGLGLSTPEQPIIAPFNMTKLQVGMVIALEPGVYIPGVGGVRIEDDVLVTAAGPRLLTHCTREF